MTTEVENSQATSVETITKKNKKKKKPKQQRSCSTCSKVSDRLVLGLQSLDKVALAFVTLQEELKLAQTTLYETKLDMNKAIQELKNSEVDQEEEEEEERSMIDERDDETNNVQVDMVKESISTSASDTEGKKAGRVVQQSKDANNAESTDTDRINDETNIVNGDGEMNIITSNSSPSSPSVANIIMTYGSPYLVESPNDYIKCLHSELGVSTPADLVEVIGECLEVLACMNQGNKGVGDVVDSDFYKIVLGSVARGKEEEYYNAILNGINAMGSAASSDSIEISSPPTSVTAADASKAPSPAHKSKRSSVLLDTSYNTSAIVSKSSTSTTSKAPTPPKSKPTSPTLKSITAIANVSKSSSAGALKSSSITSKSVPSKGKGTVVEINDKIGTLPRKEYNLSLPVAKEDKSQQQGDEKKRREDNAKKHTQQKTERKEAAERARQQEKEREDMEGDQQRRKDMKKEKQLAMEEYDTKVNTPPTIEAAESTLLAHPLHEAELNRLQQVHSTYGQNSFDKQLAIDAQAEENVVEQTLSKSIEEEAKVNEGGSFRTVTPHTSSVEEEIESPSSQSARRGRMSPRNFTKTTVVVDQLSLYIKPYNNKKARNHHPVFDLIQNENTVADGRRLMILENEASTCKAKLYELQDLEVRLEKGMQSEVQQSKTCTNIINIKDMEVRATLSNPNRFTSAFIEENAERPISTLNEIQLELLLSKMAADDIIVPKDMSHIKKLQYEERAKGQRKLDVQQVNKAWGVIKLRQENIANSDESIERQQAKLNETRVSIPQKIDELSQIRLDIQSIKEIGVEDEDFHIDRTKDTRGFTILMIAAQSNDFFTAKVCFDLGADAFVKGPDNVTAIQYSSFFGFKEVTDLITKVRTHSIMPIVLFVQTITNIFYSLQNGGRIPKKQSEAWDNLHSMTPKSADLSQNWDDTLRVSETAALPSKYTYWTLSHTLLSSVVIL